MELQEYLNILKKRWVFLVVITLVSTLVSAISSYFIIKPIYKADISVIIQKENNIDPKNPTNYNDVLMYQKLVKTYSELVKSRTVAENAIGKLGIDMKASQLQSMISVAPKGDTEFLTITVKSKDAKQAMNLANQLAQSLKEVGKQVKNMDAVQILDPAELPTTPDSPKPKLNIAIAFFLGIMISVGIIFLLEYLDNTVKSSEDIEKLLGIPVIGTIPLVTEAK